MNTQLPTNRSNQGSEPYPVDRQIIITGREKDIKEVVKAAQDALAAFDDNDDVPMTRHKNVMIKRSLDYLELNHLLKAIEPVIRGVNQDLAKELDEYKDLQIHLYDIVEWTPDQHKKPVESEPAVWKAIRTIYQCAAQKKVIVLADPNVITVNPNGGAGGGNPTPVMISKRPANAGDFEKHWAFGPEGSGIKLEDADGNRQVTGINGGGARVFLLDVLNQETKALLQAEEEQVSPGKEKWHAYVFPHRFLKGNQTGIRLEIRDDIQTKWVPEKALAETDKEKKAIAEQEEVFKDHGLYVAGLVNRVAPEARIHLVNALDNRGNGEIYTLIQVLFAVIEDAVKASAQKKLPLSDVIVNMSLKAVFTEDLLLATKTRDAMEQLWMAVKGNPGNDKVSNTLLKDMLFDFDYVPSLRIPIMILDLLGAVLVASAGNDSAKRYGNEPMAIPARYREVIGVAANNFWEKQANYSNLGNIFAPGGGYKDPEDPDVDVGEENPIKPKDKDEVLQNLAMVSTVPETKETDGFAYWCGTSFSAPLVSGLAALVLQKYCEQDGVNGEPVRGYVRSLIMRQNRRKIIDIGKTLDAVK